MTDSELIPYLAGFFDGEGTISLGRFKPHGGGYRIAIAVGQNTPTVLELFKARFGGHVYRQKWVKARSAAYSWQVTKQSDKRTFLETVSPFLIEKKREAEIGLAFLGTIVRHRHYTVDEKAARHRVRTGMFDEMKAIKRGRTLLAIKEAESIRKVEVSN